MSQTIREQVREIPGATLKYVEELFGEEMDKILGLARLLKVKAGKRFITQNDEIRRKQHETETRFPAIFFLLVVSFFLYGGMEVGVSY